MPNIAIETHCISFERLLRPIEGKNSSGDNLQYAVLYDDIREARRSEDIEELGEWKRETKTSDWNKVIALSTDALETKTKDLQLAVWFSEALVNSYGFVGLCDSLQLLKGLLENFWDSIYPENEDGDLEARANAFSWFDSQISICIKQFPITASNLTDNYSYLQYEESKLFDIPEKIDDLSSEEKRKIEELKELAEKEKKTTSEQWRKAQNTSPISFYQTTFNLLDKCLKAFLELDKLMDEKFLSQTPGLGKLKKSLEDIFSLIGKIYKEKQPIKIISEPQTNLPQDLIESMEKSSIAEQTSTKNLPISAGAISCREDALDRLKNVAGYFRKTEPHSPVAFLVERAIKWGEMPLDQWLEEVIKNSEALDQVRETLGIKN
ncbi:MAG: type VI secretion system protein TssA [Acidobacteria bacterium]|nr:type VI secretion system protein TssA [Acidobacteriota bacterium]